MLFYTIIKMLIGKNNSVMFKMMVCSATHLKKSSTSMQVNPKIERTHVNNRW